MAQLRAGRVGGHLFQLMRCRNRGVVESGLKMEAAVRSGVAAREVKSSFVAVWT